MKKIILLSLTCIMLQSCGVKLNTEDFIYKEGVTFKGERIVHAKTKEKGHGRHSITYIAAKGTRFVQLHLKFENKSGVEQIVDPEDIFLLDDNNNKYSVDVVIQGVTANPYRVKEHRLKAGDSKRFLFGFDPGFPTTSKVRILVRDKIYSL